MNRYQYASRAALVVMALTVVAAACTYATDPDEQAARITEREIPGARATPVGPTVTLPDPGVSTGECQLVTYTPPTAEEAHGARLCLPDTGTDERDVAIVLIHGGGGTGGDNTGMTGWADAYNEAGYTTLAINYDLFTPGARSPVFPSPEQDVKAAVQFLRGTADTIGIDPERIVVHGVSAGARIGAVAYTTPNDPWFDGAALWDGIDDRVDAFIGFYSTYDGTLANDVQYHGGRRDDTDPEVRTSWAKADAIVNSTEVVGPAIFFTGGLDWAELITQQNQFVEGVIDAGYTAEAFISPGGEHGYDSSGIGLTRAGEVSAAFALAWLDRIWPVT